MNKHSEPSEFDRELCRKIKDYWRAQGFPKIDARIETISITLQSRNGGTYETFHHKIVSNLGPQGFPPR